MNTLLTLALLTTAGSVRATEPAPPAAQEQGSAQRLAPELVRLDQVLTMAQRARDEGRFTPERYAEFLSRFRPSLEKARETTPPSPAATALYARILARLGEPKQAADALEPALKERPDDTELRVALGHIRYQQRDFAAALAEAEAALAREPGNQAALALKYLSKGRTAGDATPAPSLPPSGMEAPSVLQDPRLVDAGLKSLGRRNALQFTDEAMRRIKIQDPQEALRYLALAEASDPTLPDVPMQQGIAFQALKQHPDAVERYGRAESMWRALGTAQGAQLADIARQGREGAASLANSAPGLPPPETPPAGLPPWTPLAAGGLLFATLGAYGVQRSRATRVSEEGLNPQPEVSPDQESRNWFASAAVVGVGLVALAAWQFGPTAFVAARTLLTTTGPTALGLTPAAAGASGGTFALEQAVVAEGAKAAGATGVLVTGAFVSYSKSGQQPSEGQVSQGTEGPSSSIKKPSAKDPELQNLIDDLFQPSDSLPGGTGGALRNEKLTGQATKGIRHHKKAPEYVQAINKLLRRRATGKGPPLDAQDQATAEAMRQHLLDAINLPAKAP